MSNKQNDELKETIRDAWCESNTLYCPHCGSIVEPDEVILEESWGQVETFYCDECEKEIKPE